MSIGSEGNVVNVTMVCYVGKMMQGADFELQKQKVNHAGSVWSLLGKFVYRP
jgi:hypothetical protein